MIFRHLTLQPAWLNANFNFLRTSQSQRAHVNVSFCFDFSLNDTLREFFQLREATEEEGALSKRLVSSCPFNALCDKCCKNHQTFTFHSIFQFFVLKYAQFGQTSQRKTPKNIKCQDCALAMPGGLWHLTFAPRRLEILIIFFFI